MKPKIVKNSLKIGVFVRKTCLLRIVSNYFINTAVQNIFHSLFNFCLYLEKICWQSFDCVIYFLHSTTTNILFFILGLFKSCYSLKFLLPCSCHKIFMKHHLLCIHIFVYCLPADKIIDYFMFRHVFTTPSKQFYFRKL